MNTSVLSGPEGIARACELIRAGEVVALPTETVYGLAADATQTDAVLKIFNAKERPHFDPLIVHVAQNWSWQSPELQSVIDFKKLSSRQTEEAPRLIQRYWPGPLTLILPKKPAITDLTTSGLSTVGIRCPQHPIFQAVLIATGRPLAAPSANRFGKLSPTSAKDVREELEGRIPLVLDGGRCEVGVESTILGWNAGDELILLRPGKISQAELEAELQRSIRVQTAADSATPIAPGLLASHYAPRTPMKYFDPKKDLSKLAKIKNEHSRLGYIAWRGSFPDFLKEWVAPENFGSLSQGGDWNEIARHLFMTIRSVDNKLNKLTDLILIEKPPVTQLEGIAFAVFDRISRSLTEN